MSRSLIGPTLQCLAFLGLIAVNVVDLVDALLLMAEDQLGDERRDAERRQVGARGPSQIMETPIGQPGTAHRLRPCRGRSCGCRVRPPVVENTKSPPVKRGSDRSRSMAMPESGTSCGTPLFGATCRNDPERIIEIDLAPRHVGRLATADRRQEQEARKWHRPGRCPRLPATAARSRRRSGHAGAAPCRRRSP